MSCILSGYKTIARAVRAIVLAQSLSGEWRGGMYGDRYFLTPEGTVDMETADKLGRDIADLNMQAYSGRYRDEEYNPEYGAGFFFSRPFSVATECPLSDQVQIYKSLRFVAYQCGEDATIHSDLLKKMNAVSADLAMLTLRRTQEFEAAEWG